MAWPMPIGLLMSRLRPRFGGARRTTCCSYRDRCAAARSIHPFQRGRFAFFNLAAGATRAVVTQELARQALIGDGGVRGGYLPASPADVGQPALGAAQPEIGCLLARFTGPGLLDHLLGLLVGTLLLRPRCTGL